MSAGAHKKPILFCVERKRRSRGERQERRMRKVERQRREGEEDGGWRGRGAGDTK
jgi:hypothetical protein